MQSAPIGRQYVTAVVAPFKWGALGVVTLEALYLNYLARCLQVFGFVCYDNIRAALHRRSSQLAEMEGSRRECTPPWVVNRVDDSAWP